MSYEELLGVWWRRKWIQQSVTANWVEALVGILPSGRLF
jgi:hypothetical protein